MNLLEVNVTQNMSFIERVKEITKRLMEDLEHKKKFYQKQMLLWNWMRKK